MKRKSVLSLLLVLCMVLSLAGCAGNSGVQEGTQATSAPAAQTATPTEAQTAAPTEAAQPEFIDFTDDTGRTVSVPAHITRIAVSGPMTQILVFALAPDMLVGISNAWNSGTEAYFDSKYLDLPVLGQLYGGKGELNLETLLAADPQIVLDVGEAKEGAAEDLDALSEQTGIPFIHIDADTASFAEAFRKLGALLGLEEQAAVLADYCEEMVDLISRVSDAVGENRVRLLYLLGDKGLNVIASGSYHGEIFDLVTDNAAVLDNPSSKGTGNETDMEQLLLWDPDFIIFSADSVGETVADDPIWQQLTAIQEGKYAIAPFGPYNWMGFPPSVQRYLGILWMIRTLYPEQANYDLQTEVNRYFDLFYHCRLTDSQYAEIIG